MLAAGFHQRRLPMEAGRTLFADSVEVADLMRVVRYSHVMHLESEVHGTLRSDLTMYDALRSCLPAGTLAGAPKIRAMEIVADMEKQRRGPYGGAVGYFGFQGYYGFQGYWGFQGY